MEEDSKALTQEEVKDLLDLVEKYRKEREQKLGELSFFYNILEEVRVNENAHTRLLMRLLQYDPARKDFFKYLEGKGFYLKGKDFASPKKMSKPKITVEKYRIDGLIQKEGEYAIIIENKVCGAVDQEGQLERYIDKCKKDLKDDLEKVYILYLVNSPGQEPSEQTWGKYTPKDFKGRYLVLSYTEDIISWLEGLRNTLDMGTDDREKTELLRSGITQYLEYLKQLFRTNQYKEMDKELRRFVEKELGLDKESVPEGKKDLLKKEVQSIDRLKSVLNELLCNSYVNCWRADLKENYSSIRQFSQDDEVYPKAGIYMQIDGVEFPVLAEFAIEESRACVGIGYHEEEGDKIGTKLDNKLAKQDLKEKVQMGNFGRSKFWYCWRYVDPDEAMTKFEKLVEALKELGAKPVPAESAEK